MNAPYDMERDLTQWMAAVAPSRAPDNLAPSIVAQTRSMRPRPGWLARLLEPPMQTQLSLRRAVGLRRSPRLVLVAMLILALVAAGVLVGSQLIRRQSLPAPFGLAGNGLIAADAGGKIFVMRPDGTEVRALDLPFPHVAKMAFSRDGTRLAAWAAASADADERSLIVANADGSGASNVGDFSGNTDDGVSPLAWSPDDRLLAFTGQGGALYLVDPADASAREIAPNASIVARHDPTWAPDGRLAYRCQTDDGQLHLCVTTADLITERILKTSPGSDFAFLRSSWSHDGKHIAYQVDDTTDHPAYAPGYDIATMDMATETERILTRGTAEHMILPVWTPDNRYILSIGGGIVAADGSGVRLVGDGRCGWTEPSPDGRFLMCIGDGRQVELHPIEGGPATVLPLDGEAGIGAWQRLAH
jgi:hypothetical protein